MVKLPRLLRHLLTPDWRVRQCFPRRAMQAVEAAIAASEKTHAGEIRFAVEAALGPVQLLRGESARERAIEVFSALRVWDTELNSGVLIYVLLADHDVEIVADRGISSRVPQAEWEGICRRMERSFRKGEFEAGTLAAIAEIGTLLDARYPASVRNPNELPDRPAIL